MENVRNRMKMELVSCPMRCAKLFNKTNFKSCTIYDNDLVAVHLHKDLVEFNKPIFVGFFVLEISKNLIYDFHYNTIKKMYNDNAELCYMDTDSLIYFIKTRDFYDDVRNNVGFLEKLDTSNFPIDHACYTTERKKLLSTFTDETQSESIREFVALRAKSYCFNLAGHEHIKAKGVAKHAVKKHMTLEDHKSCLFNGVNGFTAPNNYSALREMRSFRSYKHEVSTISTMKLALNRHDDKRVVLPDQIYTLAHGHYGIEFAFDVFDNL